MNPQPPALRIVYLNSLLSGGGTDDQCVKIAGELHRLGQGVVLAGPGGSVFQTTIDQLGLPFVDTGARSKAAFVLRAARVIRREGAQIVHGHHGRDLWPTVLAARLSGVRPKIVLTRHMAKSPGSWAGRNLLLGRCDALIAVSHFVAKVLCQGDADPASPEAERHCRPPMRGDFSKIHVIHGGIDTNRFCPMDASATRSALGLAAGDYAFGVVGGFDFPRGKGQREFLRAAAIAAAKVPRARFLIVGQGRMEPILREDISSLGLEGKAWLTGQRSNMPEVMNALDCLVHPQIGTEALGLVVCEAQACGKPIIASALDGIPEAFAPRRHGCLVTPESIEELAQAMVRQVGVPPLSAEDAEHLHRWVERNFSLGVAAARHLLFYLALLARGRRADQGPIKAAQLTAAQRVAARSKIARDFFWVPSGCVAGLGTLKGLGVARNKVRGDFGSKPLYVTFARMGKVVGDVHLAATADDIVFGDLQGLHGVEDPSSHWSLQRFRYRRRAYLAGASFLLAAGAADNYYHWLFDSLPRVQLLQKAAVSLAGIDHILLGQVVRPFHEATLDALRIPCSKILRCSKSQVLQCGTLVLASAPAPPIVFPPWVIEFLRESFLPLAGPAGPKQKIFVSRRGERRRLTNQMEVETWLAARGFKTVYMEDMAFAAQIACFANASAIVAIHGAALANLVFASAGTPLIELVGPTFINHCYAKLAAAMSVKYTQVLGALTAQPRKRPEEDDFAAPIPALREALDKAGA